jgi:hypothetical protein
MSIITFLVFTFNNNCIINGLDSDFAWLEMMNIDTSLESILAEMQVLLIFSELAGSLTSECPWTAIAGWQMMSSVSTWNNASSEITWQQSQSEAWFQS